MAGLDAEAGTLSKTFFPHSPYLAKPRRETTVAIHTNRGHSTLNGTHDGFSTVPSGTVRPWETTCTFREGPGQKLIGGDLRYAYSDRPQTQLKMGRTKDFAEILQGHKTSPNATLADRRGAEMVSSEVEVHLRATANSRTIGSHIGQVGKSETGSLSASVLAAAEAVPLSRGTAVQAGNTTARFHMDSYEPPQEVTWYPRRPAWDDTLRTYAYGHKFIGHKEYEASCKGLDGLNCWTRTGLGLTSSMRQGHPSRLLDPFEHTVTRLSTLYGTRRPATTS